MFRSSASTESCSAAKRTASPSCYFLGAVAARLPFVPLNYRLADAQLGGIVTERRLSCGLEDQRERLARLGVAEVVDAVTIVDAAAYGRASPFDRAPALDPEDVALLLYTSGTTAAPKAAVLRHRHLASYVIGTVEFGSVGADEAALLSVPPYHIAGVMNLLSNLYMGRRLVYLDAFDPERWLAGGARTVDHARNGGAHNAGAHRLGVG